MRTTFQQPRTATAQLPAAPASRPAQPAPPWRQEIADAFTRSAPQRTPALTGEAAPPQAFAYRGPTYRGEVPAEGTTDSNAAWPVDPPLTNAPSARSGDAYNNVINQFAVGSNPRYAQRGGNTYCNIFAWDVTRAMGAEIPHWVYPDGTPAQPGAAGAYELDANGGHRWLLEQGPAHGWREVSAEEAQAMANAGHPTVASMEKPGGIGHIAVVRPGTMGPGGPHIAQAGALNTNSTTVGDIFGGGPVRYFVNASGTSLGHATSTASSAGRGLAAALSGSSASIATGVSAGGSWGGSAVGSASGATGGGGGGWGSHAGSPGGGAHVGASPGAASATSSHAPVPSTRPSLPAVPAAGLSFGHSGSSVSALQRLLIALGLLDPEDIENGVFDAATMAALRAFQRERGLPPTGSFDAATHAAMGKAAAAAELGITPPGHQVGRLEVPYISQLSSDGTADDWNRNANCGPASMAMIARAFGYGAGMKDGTLVNELGRSIGIDGNGTGWDGVRRMAVNIGLHAEHRAGSDLGWIQTQLEAGKLIAANGDRGVTLANSTTRDGVTGGHWIVVTGMTADGNFLVMDPSTDCRVLTPGELKRFLDTRQPDGGHLVAVGD